jgi:Ulp1 family protease
MATKRKKSPAVKTRSRSKKSKSILNSILLLLVVLLSLAAIAFAASYVYLRTSVKKNTENRIESIESESLNESAFTEKPEAELLASESDKAQKNNLSQPSVLHGTWVSTENGAMLTVENSGFTIDFPSVEAIKPMKGTINVSKNSFVVVNKRDALTCPEIEGNYDFEFKGEDLIIKLKKDKCSQRASQLNASWFRL